MKKFFLVCALFIAASGAFGDVAYSTNIFGMVKLESSATNTLIAVPWVGYTPDALPSRPEYIDHLVKPDNLTVWEAGQDGDMLLVVGTNKQYMSWHLCINENGIKYWQRAQDIVISANGATNCPNQSVGDCISRGYGLWLIRRDVSKTTFYLEGQYTGGGTSVTVRAGTSITPNSVMIAHPVCSGRNALDVNKEIAWTDVNEGDTLSVPCVNSKWDLCMWDPENGWYRTKTVVTEWTDKKGKTHRETEQLEDYDITIPVGQGFWYVNRGPKDVTITFD